MAAIEVPVGADLVEAPFGGSVWKLMVAEGDEVEAGDVIAVIEAMKMECAVESPGSGTVAALYLKERQAVQPGAPMMALRRNVSPPGEGLRHVPIQKSMPEACEKRAETYCSRWVTETFSHTFGMRR
mgnify:CR=1 FL=1